MPLNVSRRQDRLVMAGDIRAIVKAPWTIEDEELEGTRELWVKLKGPRGLQITIDLDGDSKQQREGVFVLAWHIAADSDARLNPSMMVGCNPYHFRKLTEVAYSFEALLRRLQVVMTLAANGSAFQSDITERSEVRA